MNELMPELLPSSMKDETMDRTRLRTREAMQDLILRSLSESGFSDIAVFHGGTCLRKLYGLNRLSEDLDFSLVIPKSEFNFEPHLEHVVTTFHDERLELQAKIREARGELPIFSVMYGVNFRNILEMAGFSERVISSVHRDELVRVKMDVDTNPPSYRRDSIVHRDGVVSYDIRTEELPVLYAGKMSAVLCRQWKHPVKGGDLFDYVWYIERGTPLDMRALESRLEKSTGLPAIWTGMCSLRCWTDASTAWTWRAPGRMPEASSSTTRAWTSGVRSTSRISPERS